MTNDPKTVSDIVSAIKMNLESTFRSIFVVGEISNLSSSAAGHWYFTLSDGHSAISCALFKMDAFRNPIIRKLKNGDQVYITGPISVYAKRGTFQLLAKKMMPAGKGDLLAKYEMLKEKLKREGLFDLDLKKEIPKYPEKIAVITALKAAALQDFINVIQRRSLWSQIVIVPAVVQGDASAKSLQKAYTNAQKIKDVDVIVLTRGGGAMEDLWSFNDEKLARLIYESNVPTISAIGHQVDYTICDYVSDLRCETPTAAAEVLTQAQTQLKQRMKYTGHQLKSLLFEVHSNIEKKIKKLNPLNQLHLIKQKLYEAKEHLYELKITHRADELLSINDYQFELDEYMNRTLRAVENKFSLKKHRIELISSSLKNIDPKNVLRRGYSIVHDDKDEVVTNLKKFNKLSRDKILTLQFADGSAKVQKEQK